MKTKYLKKLLKNIPDDFEILTKDKLAGVFPVKIESYILNKDTKEFILITDVVSF